MYLAKGTIPENGLATKGVGKSRQRLGSKDEREFLLDVAVERNHDGPYVVATRFLNQASPLGSFDEPPPPWLDGKAMVSISVAGSGATVSAEAGKPLVLVRVKTAYQGPSEGLMRWIAEYK